MTEQLIEFETAKLAFEKGFKERCGNHYNLTVKGGYGGHGNTSHKSNNEIPAPTQSLLQKWLREVHNLHIQIEILGDKKDYPRYSSRVLELEDSNSLLDTALDELKVSYEDLIKKSYSSYEECLEQGLLNALKLIK